MALFGKRKPRLPSYVAVGLEGLLSDPEWSGAIARSGIEPAACEVVLRLADATVGAGFTVMERVSPAILFGQGDTLAVAYPGEREVTVAKRATSRAELQTQRSGCFQIMFGPATNLNGFVFDGGEDNLKLESPEGEAFGKVMSAFLRGGLQPQQVVGTPQSLVASGIASTPRTPSFDDLDDALRWDLVHALHASLESWMETYQRCFETAEDVERAYGLAGALVVDGVQHHEISRKNFREHGNRMEQELVVLLGELRERTDAARGRWDELLGLLPGTEHEVMRIVNWCMAHEVDSEVSSYLSVNGLFIRGDYGLTRESFWVENTRITNIMRRSEG
ncbi:MAG: hypothetical protein ITG02_06395 [Patulibacter sp.]|nr:hypothetical protein [Patulibacter sp.]